MSRMIRVIEYKSKKSLSDIDINPNVDYQMLCFDSAIKLGNINPFTLVNLSKEYGADVVVEAYEEVMSSLVDSANGENKNYNHSAENKINGQATYETVTKNIKESKESGRLYVQGTIINRSVIEVYENKPVNSKSKTIVKDLLKKSLPISKWIQLDITDQSKYRRIEYVD